MIEKTKRHQTYSFLKMKPSFLAVHSFAKTPSQLRPRDFLSSLSAMVRPQYLYLKMKLSSKHPKPSPISRYIKYVLWAALSLYLFASRYRPSPSPLDIKIYSYDLPPQYNSHWLADPRCEKHLFAAEVAVHRALLKSPYITSDPEQADFFFVPVYVSCNFSAVNGFPAIGHARSLLASAVDVVSSDYPFWNRTGGRDHIFVASHDYGACFHAMEDAAIRHGIPPFMKNSIILQTFGVKYHHLCQDVEHIVIPPYVSPARVPADGRRDIWAFFRGKMEVHPKNVSGRFYSRRVRTEMWERFNADRRFYLKRHRFAGYRSEIGRSVFCLCPLGWAPWSPRIVESVSLGCVPVIIADGIRLPFDDFIRWPDISISVPERHVGKLRSILADVAETNLTDIQRNLWDPRNRLALLYHERIRVGDATWRILEALQSRLDRSYRRSRSVHHERGKDRST